MFAGTQVCSQNQDSLFPWTLEGFGIFADTWTSGSSLQDRETMYFSLSAVRLRYFLLQQLQGLRR